MTWRELLAYVKRAFRLYLVFRGRARRKEFLSWALFYSAAYLLVLWLVGTVGDEASPLAPLLGLLALGAFLLLIPPTVAVSVRRLHDTERSGLWLLLALVPLGPLVLLLFLLQRGQPGENRYGPDPRAEEVEA